jgi:hypothetical protein
MLDKADFILSYDPVGLFICPSTHVIQLTIHWTIWMRFGVVNMPLGSTLKSYLLIPTIHNANFVNELTRWD